MNTPRRFLMNSVKRIFTNAYFYLVITFVLWGSLYVVSKYVVGKLPTFTISFLRFLLAFLFLLLIAKKPEKRIAKKHLPYVFCIGFVGYFIAVGAQLLGTKLAGASMASLLNSLNPVTMTIFGALLLHEKLTVRKLLGIFLAIGGVAVIFGNNMKGVGLNGILLSLFSVLVSTLLGIVFLKEQITWRFAAGALCIVAGVLISLWKGKKEEA